MARRQRFSGSKYTDGQQPPPSDLTGEALRLLREKPVGWPERLFGQLLYDGISDSRDFRRDAKYKVELGDSTDLTNLDDFRAFVEMKLGSLQQILSVAGRLINDGLKDALSEAHSQGSADGLTYVSGRIVDTYKSLIDWSLGFRRIYVNDKYQRAVELASELSSPQIKDIEEFSESLQDKLRKAVALIDLGESPNVEWVLEFTAPDADPMVAEMARLYGQVVEETAIDVNSSTCQSCGEQETFLDGKWCGNCGAPLR